MTAGAKYVCAFRGRRDYYQLPLALAERAMLDQFITDAYFVRGLRAIDALLRGSLSDRVHSRYEQRIPDDRISCLWGTTIIERLRHSVRLTPWKTLSKMDRRFSLAASKRARQTKSNLFLYNPYAWEAFVARYDHAPRRILFQYHPHTDFERRILRDDAEAHRIFHHSYEREMLGVGEELIRRVRDCWRHADKIVCASTFTKRSLIEAGANPDSCTVVPYGIDLPADTAVTHTPPSFEALFVGWGIQQKGVHHLLLAWKKAALPPGSRLTLVCRLADKGIQQLAAQTPSTRLMRGVSVNELSRLLRASSLFVMPSLVEGFGQVFLEALAHGCPVLGTPNTCLPDLGPANDAMFQVEPGNVDQLAAELERLSDLIPRDPDIRHRARECASRWPWTKFREQIRAVAAG